MNIFPAIDLFEGKAVRLFKGDYAQMTVYDSQPLNTARKFQSSGAEYLHMVDLEGAKTGGTPNLETIQRIVSGTSLFTEVGGGIRSMDTIDTYLNAGVNRVILGTAAVTAPDFLEQAVEKYGEKIAVGIDIKDGYVAIKGWTEKSQWTAEAFFSDLEKLGVSTVICTDISRDGMLGGSNHALYEKLISQFPMDLIASGGVASLEDLRGLRELGMAGAILGRAYYSGAVSIPEALKEAGAC